MNRKRRKLWAALVFISTLYLFISAQVKTSHFTSNALQELENKDQIIEVVIRYFISEHATQWNNINFYLVCLDSSSADTSQMKGIKDPRPPRDLYNALSERLADLPLPIKRLSQCASNHLGIFDTESSLRGIMYVVGERFKWIDRNNVQVYVWYFYDGLAGGSWICNLKKKADKWSVTRIERRWIS